MPRFVAIALSMMLTACATPSTGPTKIYAGERWTYAQF